MLAYPSAMRIKMVLIATGIVAGWRSEGFGATRTPELERESADLVRR